LFRCVDIRTLETSDFDGNPITYQIQFQVIDASQIPQFVEVEFEIQENVAYTSGHCAGLTTSNCFVLGAPDSSITILELMLENDQWTLINPTEFIRDVAYFRTVLDPVQGPYNEFPPSIAFSDVKWQDWIHADVGFRSILVEFGPYSNDYNSYEHYVASWNANRPDTPGSAVLKLKPVVVPDRCANYTG
jgi:hypothetical protein